MSQIFFTCSAEASEVPPNLATFIAVHLLNKNRAVSVWSILPNPIKKGSNAFWPRGQVGAALKSRGPMVEWLLGAG
jgi:hypothetical protein